MSLRLDLTKAKPDQFEILAAIAVQALCNIANHSDSEELHANSDDEELNEFGISGNEAVEMAYDNVLDMARSALEQIGGVINR